MTLLHHPYPSRVLPILMAILVLLPGITLAQTRTLMQIVDRRPALDTLAAAFKLAGLNKVLGSDRGSQEYTILAPTDTAFLSLMRDLGVSQLTDIDPATLKNVLLYHVIPGKVTSSDLMSLNEEDEDQVETIQGSELKIGFGGDGNQTLTVNDRAMVEEADIMASNGILHKIDTVLMPTITPAAEGPTVVDIIQQDRRLQTLYDCVLETGYLDHTLAITDNITLFAPTNRAFRTLFNSLNIRDCSGIDAGLLVDVLLYHVVPMAATVAEVTDGDVLPTGLGEDKTLKIDFRLRKAFVNDARIIDVDLMGSSNGVVHIINKILLP